MNYKFLTVLLLFTQTVNAKVVRVNECVVSIFGFCPFETLGIAIGLIAILLFSGFPLRRLIKKYFLKQLEKNSSYEPDPILVFLYSYSGHITIGLAMLTLLIVFSKP